MCRHPYAARWKHNKKNCPHLSKNGVGNTVTVRYQADKVGRYESLVGFWNDWYYDYFTISSFPRLIIRYEDLLFHLEEVVTQVCHCGGGTLINHEEHGIVLKSENAKEGQGHGGPKSNDLLGAMSRYGGDEKRTEDFSTEDLTYAKEKLRMDLMELFSYSYPKDDKK